MQKETSTSTPSQTLAKIGLLNVLLPLIIFTLLMVGASNTDDSIVGKGTIIAGFVCLVWSIVGFINLLTYLFSTLKKRKLKISFPFKNIPLPKISSRWLLIPVGIGVLLAFLNPSYARFKEYAEDFTTTKRKTICKRINNYLIFSVYQKQVVTIDDGEYEYTPPENYIGFCMNFYREN